MSVCVMRMKTERQRDRKGQRERGKERLRGEGITEEFGLKNSKIRHIFFLML